MEKFQIYPKALELCSFILLWQNIAAPLCFLFFIILVFSLISISSHSLTQFLTLWLTISSIPLFPSWASISLFLQGLFQQISMRDVLCLYLYSKIVHNYRFIVIFLGSLQIFNCLLTPVTTKENSLLSRITAAFLYSCF